MPADDTSEEVLVLPEGDPPDVGDETPLDVDGDPIDGNPEVEQITNDGDALDRMKSRSAARPWGPPGIR